MGSVPTIRLLRLKGFPLLQQLYLEEALFRAHPDNWFVINDGVEHPTVVLGISGKSEELVHTKEAHAAGIPLVKRFTGGGTVVVDSDSILTSFIMHGPSAVPLIPCYPRPIMSWTEGVLRSVFAAHGAFSLREHDYVLGERKFGGNAQAISKDRWLHHTSFLWDYQPERMALLKHPQRTPEYRQGREHSDFIVRLKDIVPSRVELVDGLCYCLENEGFRIVEGRLEEAYEAVEKNSLCGSRVLDPEEYLVS